MSDARRCHETFLAVDTDGLDRDRGLGLRLCAARFLTQALRKEFVSPECPLRDGAMKRFRLSTLMLLIVIVACCIALVMQQRRAAVREAAWKARFARLWQYRPLKAATGAIAGFRADGS